MRDQTSAGLTGWFEYLHIDDEIQTSRLVYAIVRAFNGDKTTKKPVDDDEEEIIDTTKPEFVEQFKGFTGVPGGSQQVRRPFNQRPLGSTQLIKG